jgi:glutathione S-transferase
MKLPRVYGMSSSGNCYKVRLLMEQLQLPFEWIEIDVRSGLTRQPEFLAKNANGRVPTLEYQPGQYLVESDAILVYLAEGSGLWPQHRLERAQALQWMFFEQYSHEPYIAVARFICAFLPADHARRSELHQLHVRGYQALAVMEQQLIRTRFFVGDAYSVADIALYAYTHAAGDGGFDLQRFPAVCAWLARVQSQPHFLPMPPPP